MLKMDIRRQMFIKRELISIARVREPSLSEKTAAKIEGFIQEKKWSAGDRLPNEFALADELLVGRGTIREAVKLLVSRNILEIRRGKGTFVADRPGQLDDPLGLSYYKDKKQLAADLLDVRMMLEPQIASLAAQRASLEDVEELRRLCGEIEQNREDPLPYTSLNRQLHTKIAESTHNAVVAKLMPVVQTDIGPLLDQALYLRREEAIRTNREIVSAIASHDSVRAMVAAKKLLEYQKIAIRTM